MKGAKLSRNMKRVGQSYNIRGWVLCNRMEPGPILESFVPDTMIDRGTRGVDASTPILRPNYQARPRPFRHFWTLIPDAPPPL